VLREAGATYRSSLDEATKAYRDAVDTHTQQMGQVIDKLRSQVTEAAKRVSDMTAEAAAERARLTSLTSEFQAQFSTAQDTRSKEYNEAQASRQERFGGVVAEHTKSLAEQSAEYTKQREADARLYQDHVTSMKTRYEASATALLEDITRRKEGVEKLVGVIGNLAVTSGYLRAANHARWSTWIWQFVTVAAMGGVIIVAWKAFIPLVAGTFSGESFAGRVFVSIAVGVLAAYAASQADKYARVEGHNRKLALELEAIGPYLSSLPTEKQEALRVQIAERTFGQPDSFGGEKSPASIVDVLLKSAEFRDLITSIIKAAKP
jgi:hypothetical protein